LTEAHRYILGRAENAVMLESPAGPWRAHWIPRTLQPTWQPLLDDRLRLHLDVLPECSLIEDDGGLWVAAQASNATASPWHDRSAAADPLERLKSLVADVASLARTLEQLHNHGRTWLTFDPAAIEDAGPVAAEGEAGIDEPPLRLLRITNLDLGLFRLGECPPSLSFHSKYAPPEVCGFRAADIGSATDVYHLVLFAYYWCAGLLPDGFAGAGLESFAHHLPPLRPYAPDLPEGIIPVIQRGLAIDPKRRYATPGEFVQALRERLADAQRRRQFHDTLHWDGAYVTRSGRTKEALGKDNEDHGLVHIYTEQPGVLAAVADGISTCDVGSGALASLIAAIVLENRFDAGSSHDDFPRQAAEACQQGSERILEWAVEKGYREQLALGLDLMGTTLTIGWVQGHELSVSNLGDSRAYLVTPAWIDQLTVDGDLGTELLARGSPPEQVLRMGVVARALRGCVGGCTLNEGRVEVMPESNLPTFSRWPVAPGDVVLLCTDGLIEEGLFLEPETAAEIIRTNRHLPAEELARLLAEAADATQRPPSAMEPEGFGDNITCAVIKIEGE
jgi:serine/threonine protein phosphatase PrpC